MSEELINQITLNCLMNKQQYERYIASKVSKSVKDEDKKFYRKRIYCLTKDLLLKTEEPDNLLPYVKYAFDQYVKSCIHYFKVLDSNDIVQEQYKELDDHDNKSDNKLDNILEEEVLENPLDVKDLKEKDESSVRLIKSFYNPFEEFFTPKDQIILPKQREMNLQDPSLMNKGTFPPSTEKKKNLSSI